MPFFFLSVILFVIIYRSVREVASEKFGITLLYPMHPIRIRVRVRVRIRIRVRIRVRFRVRIRFTIRVRD